MRTIHGVYQRQEAQHHNIKNVDYFWATHTEYDKGGQPMTRYHLVFIMNTALFMTHEVPWQQTQNPNMCTPFGERSDFHTSASQQLRGVFSKTRRIWTWGGAPRPSSIPMSFQKHSQ